MAAFFTRRPAINATALGVLIALYLLAAANITFWGKAWEGFVSGMGLAAFGVATLAVFVGVMVGLSFRFIAKPVYIFAILVAAGASYFTDTFGTIINANMIENVLATNSGETGEFLTASFFVHMLVFGILPSLLVMWVQVIYGPFRSRLLTNATVLVVMLLVAGGLIFSHLGEVRAAMRRDFNAMMEVLNPAGPVSAAIKVVVQMVENRHAVREPYGRDARKGEWIAQAKKPVVTVIVVGESARAMNFSLNGYARDTNPELAKLGVLNFSNVTSCGTETSISLRCMFSGFQRTDFSKSKAIARESLMDVYKNAGIDVHWWDNDGGAKGVANGVKYTSYMMRTDPDLCQSGACQDDIFLGDLDTLIGAATGPTVVVLHQRGSHGPAYYLRYPDTFRPFQPDCRLYQMNDCSSEEIVNAYDNTIAYTDRFLARVIGLLDKHRATASGAMFFVSDHGESLGENGVFMHGAPFASAPKEQTHVPLIAWMSREYDAASGFDRACAAKLSALPFSHDNVYHTLLGMMDIRTSVYRPELDIFGKCRVPAVN
ncbi:phosphoethanolamine--lipid A transferase [Rhizobium sp. TH2]|uniref:phosphoethanolamine transferase n=1 Tax=Rhizobium sp. TH2 TaxID=2775403 RepID=UPI002157523A|nr:phosphoethanolamine--lipid A transferase [Rhizobium sp. TH2]UVC07797.1 phosphoethanolamine--lipid A transferase [Rhizobium sp. TH2]